MLASPEPTPYDLRWSMLGIRVRVHPFFWLMSAVLGWPLLEWLGSLFLLIWVGCVFVSVLLHELGHVLAGRLFGAPGHIVLYSFGGLAIGSSALDSRWQRIFVYFAGPAIQLILFAALWFPFSNPDFIPARQDTPLEAALCMLRQINLYWAVLNLFPIFPLDGGQISRDFLDGIFPKKGARFAVQLSILIAGFLALHAVLAEVKDQQIIPYLPTGFYIAILFGMLALMNVQMLMAMNERDRWVDDRTPWDDPNW